MPKLGTAPDDALNAICPYWTMFPLQFPLQALADGRPDEWVLDPFCGRGTTLYAARKLGLPAVGIDSNPVAVAIAQAKLIAPRPAAIVQLARELLDGETAVVPEGRFWELAYHPDVLDRLCRLRAGLDGREDTAAVGLRGVLLGALHGPLLTGQASYLSNQMPRTYATKPKGAVAYWERNEMLPPNVDVLDVISRHARRRYLNPPTRAGGDVWVGDAPEVLARLRRSFAWVVTSPPYPGMVTYRPDGWLRGWLLGGLSEPDYDRSGQLGALTGERFVSALAAVWTAVAERCSPSASMTVRFGALPSCNAGEPADLLAESLAQAEGWRLVSITDAGVPPGTGARQAEQLPVAGEHVPEIDAIARREP